MRVHRLASVISLLLAVLANASAAQKSTAAAVTLVAHVAAVLKLQAGEPTATNGSALIASTGRNDFTLVINGTGREASYIQVPILLAANVNDVLLRAACDCVSGAYITLEKTAVAGMLQVSRPVSLAPTVTFALVSGLIRNSAASFGALVPGLIGIAIPPGLPADQAITVHITMESIRQ